MESEGKKAKTTEKVSTDLSSQESYVSVKKTCENIR